MTTFAQTTPAEAFAEIEQRRIGLTPAFDARFWRASVVLKGEKHRKLSVDWLDTLFDASSLLTKGLHSPTSAPQTPRPESE